jgi:hypothetical protein
MGFLRVGNVMKYFPYPITIGFTTGIGVTLLIGQIKDFCGFTASGTEAIEKIVSYAKNISSFDLATFGIGAIGLLCVILLPKISKKIPAAFVALVVCTGATLLLNNVAGTEIATIGSKYGEVKAGFFPVDFGDIGDVKFSALIVPSIVIAFLCAIESLLSATVAAGMTGTAFDANQELVGQGAANICSSLLGGLPATGAIARTAASIENGAQSPFAGIFHAVFLLVMYFALMGVMQYIPLAVFSAILISVAINMSRFPLFAKLSRFGIRDSIILLVTFVLLHTMSPFVRFLLPLYHWRQDLSMAGRRPLIFQPCIDKRVPLCYNKFIKDDQRRTICNLFVNYIRSAVAPPARIPWAPSGQSRSCSRGIPRRTRFASRFMARWLRPVKGTAPTVSSARPLRPSPAKFCLTTQPLVPFIPTRWIWKCFAMDL